MYKSSDFTKPVYKTGEIMEIQPCRKDLLEFTLKNMIAVYLFSSYSSRLCPNSGQGCADTPLITHRHIVGAVSRDGLRFMLTPRSGREG